MHNKGNEPRKNYQKYYRNSIRLAPDYRRAGRILGFRFKLQASRLGFWCTWITKQNERERERVTVTCCEKWKLGLSSVSFFFFFLESFCRERSMRERVSEWGQRWREKWETDSGREFQFLTLLQKKNSKLLREKNNTNYAMKKKKTQSLVLFVKSTLLFLFTFLFL